MPADPLAIRVSDVVSRLYLDTFGKGPLQAETTIEGNLVVTLLLEVYTPAEKAMIEAGRQDAVLTTRTLWQHSTGRLFKAAVARVTGREVLAAIRGFGFEQDMASEIFLLAPQEHQVGERSTERRATRGDQAGSGSSEAGGG
jgi:uncharacterized protein YbcI